MQAMFDAMPGAMLRHGRTANGNWRKLFISTSIETLTGYTVSEAMQSGWMRQRVRDVDLLQLLEQLQIAFDAGNATTEFRFRHRDGRLRLFEARMCSFAAADGSREVVGVWADITRERGLAAQLDQAAKLAELGELAAGLAHELNRPLAGISLAAENALRALARLPDTTQRVHDKLSTIADMAMRAPRWCSTSRCSAVLTRATPAGGAGRRARRHDDPRPGQADGVQRPAALQPAGRAAENPGTAIPLEQVLINLISNACDAYVTAEPEIPLPQRQIWIEAQAGGRGVMIWVRDGAGGVPEAALPKSVRRLLHHQAGWARHRPGAVDQRRHRQGDGRLTVRSQ